MNDFESARSLVQRYHDAMIRKDADAFAELYTENAVHEIPLFSLFFPQALGRRRGTER